MTAGALCYMVLILGLVWGGFLFCLIRLAKEGPPDTGAESESESDE
jgi:hypothetical protein